MTILLEAAPSIEILDVGIWDHPCDFEDEQRQHSFGERTNPSWRAFEFRSHTRWLLKVVEVTGFSPIEQEITFIRTVMERAPNLRTVTLNDYPPWRRASCLVMLRWSSYSRSIRLSKAWWWTY